MTLYIQPYPFRRMVRRVASQTQPQPRALNVNVREEDEAYIFSTRSSPGSKPKI